VAYGSDDIDLPLFSDDAGDAIPWVEWPVSEGIMPGLGRARVGRDWRPLVETVRVPAYCVVDLGKPSQIRRDRVRIPSEIDKPSPSQRHRVRLALSRAGVRNGMDGVDTDAGPIAGAPSRRWTPPQAVREEDFVDIQGILEAAFYPHPESVSAAVIIRIGHVKGKPIDGNW